MQPHIDNTTQRIGPPIEKIADFENNKVKFEYANKDYDDRNLILKKDNVRVIATEESIDLWHAQSLNMPVERYQKARKDFKKLTRSMKSNNQKQIKQAKE